MPKKSSSSTSTSYQSLMGEVEKLKKQANLIRKAEVRAVVTEIHQQMKQYKLSPKDLQLGSITETAIPIASRTSKLQSSKKTKPKFKDPISGATWNGLGRTPKWIASASGKTKQDFAISR